MARLRWRCPSPLALLPLALLALGPALGAGTLLFRQGLAPSPFRLVGETR